MIGGIGPEDLPAILEIENVSYPRPWSERLFLSEFKNEMGILYGYREEGRLLGYIFSWMLFEDVHINNVAVSPEARGRGIGGRLLQEVIDEACRRGGCRAMLEVRPSNMKALGLYAKFGFKPVSVREGYYEDTGEDALVLIAEIGTVSSAGSIAPG